MDRINGANTVDLGGGKRGFRGRNMSAGLAGTEVTAAWLNDLQEELVLFIEALGIAPAIGTRTQIRESVRRLLQEQAWTYAVASGSANALIAALAMPPPALVDGLSFDLRITTTNTGPATLALNLLAVRPIHLDGDVLEGGELVAGNIVSFRYSADAAAYQVSAIQDSTGWSGGGGGGTGGDPGGGTGGTVLPGTLSWMKESGTWARASGATQAMILVKAGGGAGAGAAGTSPNASGSGGGEGELRFGLFDISALPSAPVIVGAGGLSAVNANGNNGSPSSFGSLMTANPGYGGGRNSADDVNFSKGGEGGTGGFGIPGGGGGSSSGATGGVGGGGALGTGGRAGNNSHGNPTGGDGHDGGGGGGADGYASGGKGGDGFVAVYER